MKPIHIHPPSVLCGACVLALTLALTGMARQMSAPGNVSTRQLHASELEELLSYISIVQQDDGQGGTTKTIRITGVNVQIVNGLGATNGFPDNPGTLDTASVRTNGAGNLIVGYNEADPAYDRTGSHNIIVGRANDYSSFGGLVAGSDNTLSGPHASITGGQNNQVVAQYSTINGGGSNMIELGSTHAAIAGGSNGRIHYVSAGATGSYSTVCGGDNGLIVGAQSSVVIGGSQNSCEFGRNAVAVGGGANRVQGDGAVVVGGSLNRVLQNTGAGFRGQSSVIVGGSENEVQGSQSTVCGGQHNVIDTWASMSVITGGNANAIGGPTATRAVVCGGRDRGAFGPDDWRAGDLFQEN